MLLYVAVTLCMSRVKFTEYARVQHKRFLFQSYKLNFVAVYTYRERVAGMSSYLTKMTPFYINSALFTAKIKTRTTVYDVLVSTINLLLSYLWIVS